MVVWSIDIIAACVGVRLRVEVRKKEEVASVVFIAY